MSTPVLVCLGIGVAGQLVMTGVWLWARRVRGSRRSGDFFRLSGMVQGFVAGGLAGEGHYGWALIPLALCVAFGWAAFSEPKRHARRTTVLIHADRNHP